MSETRFPEDLLTALKKRDAVLLDKAITEAKQLELPIKDILETQMTTMKWEDDDPLNSIVSIVRVLRKQDIRVDLSTLPSALLTRMIGTLLFLKPSDADWVLGNMQQPIPRINFPDVTEKDRLKIEIHVLDAEESTALCHCIRKMPLPPYANENRLCYYIRANSEYAIPLASHLGTPLNFILPDILFSDILRAVTILSFFDAKNMIPLGA